METEFYKCYSKKLKNFMTVNGVRYINKGFNHHTKKVFWIYDKDDHFKWLLTAYSKKFSNNEVEETSDNQN